MTPSVRPAIDADITFVRASWHTNFWKFARKRLEKKVYDPEQERRINRLVFKSRVLVAFFPEVPDEILGWSCISGDTLHYVYVKSVYRRRGIATGLVPGVKTYTHATDRVGEAFAKSIGAQFNPYLLESP